MPERTLDDLNRISQAMFVEALGGIFEHAPWVAEQAAPRRPFKSLTELFAAMRAAVETASADTRLALLRNHPPLAGLAARSRHMTSASVAEQGGAGLSALDAERSQAFDALNAAYDARFGFPFIIAVRRHGGDSILREFRRRVTQTLEEERATALTEVLRVSALRLADAVTGPDTLPVHGRLSTHVLDTASGRPAAGVALDLVEIMADAPARFVASATTNAGGRTDAPLIGERPLPTGTYELRFALGDYYRARGVPLADPPFLDIVPIRFGIAEPEVHYHVPLAATPWSYSTYRGS